MTTAQQNARRWCLTINNYGDADIGQFENIKESSTYFIYGKEVAASGTLHLQCFVCFKTPKRLPALKKIWPTAHFEVSVGTPDQASTYCKKDGSFVEYGTLPTGKTGSAEGGKATAAKWRSIADLAIMGKMNQIMEEYPRECVASYTKLKQIGFDFKITPPDLSEPCGEWLCGKAGVGKSYTARKENPILYNKMMNKWWDGYDHQEVVLLEDMDPSYEQSMQYFLKIWADQYAFRVEIKNHSAMIRPKKIIVTSQYHIKEIFKDPLIVEALERRFKTRLIVKIKDFDDFRGVSNKRKAQLIEQDAQERELPEMVWKSDKDGMITKKSRIDQQPKVFDYLSDPKDVIAFNKEKSCISIESDECSSSSGEETSDQEDESGTFSSDGDSDDTHSY